jgi:hypothetical protein
MVWEAGPALDAEIARRVFGCEALLGYNLDNGGPPEAFCGCAAVGCPCAPEGRMRPYSTDIAAAWTVVEAMGARGYGCDLWYPRAPDRWIQAQFARSPLRTYVARGTTMPMAICRAVLAALGMEGAA